MHFTYNWLSNIHKFISQKHCSSEHSFISHVELVLLLTFGSHQHDHVSADLIIWALSTVQSVLHI